MSGPSFREAQQLLLQRPESESDRRARLALDLRIRKIEREHRETHEELGVELCYSCDWPLVNTERVVSVTIANRGGIAKCCGNLCASKVRQLIGGPE